MTPEDIKKEINDMGDRIHARFLKWCDSNPGGSWPHPYLDFSEPGETERLHQLKLMLPTHAEEAQQARLRNIERVKKRNRRG